MNVVPDEKYLTRSENRVLYMINDFQNRYGYSPTVREICQQCFMSESYIYKILNSLQEKGYIKRRTKTIIVIESND